MIQRSTRSAASSWKSKACTGRFAMAAAKVAHCVLSSESSRFQCCLLPVPLPRAVIGAAAAAAAVGTVDHSAIVVVAVAPPVSEIVKPVTSWSCAVMMSKTNLRITAHSPMAPSAWISGVPGLRF